MPPQEQTLPIRFTRSDVFAGLFSADYKAAEKALPSRALHPISLMRGRAALLVFAFNYHETTIGPYGEVGIGIPVLTGKAGLPWLPLVLESRSTAWGIFVLHLPVTTNSACELGRALWGYPKFIAETRFSKTGAAQAVEVTASGEPILKFTVQRGGFAQTDNRPMVTFTVHDGAILRTRIPLASRYRMKVVPGSGELSLGTHRISDELRELDVSARSLMTRCYVEHSAELNMGERTDIQCPEVVRSKDAGQF